jgi:hypothetical protein
LKIIVSSPFGLLTARRWFHSTSQPRAKLIPMNLQALALVERIYCASVTQVRQAFWHKIDFPREGRRVGDPN